MEKKRQKNKDFDVSYLDDEEKSIKEMFKSNLQFSIDIWVRFIEGCKKELEKNESSKKDATEPTTENKEMKPFSFNKDFIKTKMEEILKEEKTIREIKNLSISGNYDELVLSGNLTAKSFGFKIDITLEYARIENSEKGLMLADDFKITATKFEKAIKHKFRKNMTNINEILKGILQKKIGKNIEKIWIEKGKLKAL